MKLRHWLIIFLFALLPFHALLVTLVTKLITGPGHAPIPWLAAWKEMVISVIFIIGILELGQRIWDKGLGIKDFIALVRGKARIRWFGDAPTTLILSLLIIAIILFIPHAPRPTPYFVFGFKYLFIPLIFFLLLKNLSWDEDFIERRLFPILLIVGGIVALYGIITFFLPMGFFASLGYSDAHSLYSPGTSLSAFQQIGETGIRRIQSTFAGPNQLGAWLLVPLSVLLVRSRDKGQRTKDKGMLSVLIPLSFVLIAVFLTFSRSAWIAAFMITIIAMWIMLRGRSRILALASLVGTSLVAGLLVLLIAPNLVLRSLSNRHHFERVRAGISVMMENPFGLGLGSAGPAQNRLRDACMYFDAGADISWAKDRSDLCIFVGGAQAQPLLMEKACSCPLLPENWYVQVGIELGVAGMMLFFVLIGQLLVVSYKLLVRNHVHAPVFLMLLGVSVAALFLHAWEDSAVAYTVWGMAGIVLAFTPTRLSPEAYWSSHRTPCLCPRAR